MKSIIIALLFFSTLFFAQQKFPTPYEKGNGNQTATYEEMVRYYDELAQNFESITVQNFGKDDNGEPLKVVVFDDSKNKNTPVILINNGIHPGRTGRN